MFSLFNGYLTSIHVGFQLKTALAYYSLRVVKYVDEKKKKTHDSTFILLSVVLATVFMQQESLSLSSSL